MNMAVVPQDPADNAARDALMALDVVDRAVAVLEIGKDAAKSSAVGLLNNLAAESDSRKGAIAARPVTNNNNDNHYPAGIAAPRPRVVAPPSAFPSEISLRDHTPNLC